MIKVFLYVLLFFGLIFLAMYILRKRFKKVNNTQEEKTCELMFFHTTWCPYSKKSMIEWNKFKSEWNRKKIDGYDIIFQEIDCDINEAVANKYNVEKYPTIKLLKDDSIIDFDAKPTVHTLTQFLNSSFE
jgi:thiol-disulfide isomerase/thioredoxin